jgi:hypothetical protein
LPFVRLKGAVSFQPLQQSRIWSANFHCTPHKLARSLALDANGGINSR